MKSLSGYEKYSRGQAFKNWQEFIDWILIEKQPFYIDDVLHSHNHAMSSSLKTIIKWLKKKRLSKAHRAGSACD
jgi:hypothetical protein